MSANGRVITGFSKPYVALYGIDGGGDLAYTDTAVLARGVDVTITPETSDNNDYYGDNEIIESVSGVFTGGTVSLNIDGLLPAAERMIFGLPAPDSVTVGGNSVDAYRYGDAMSIPYVGLGFVIRYMSDGVTSYVPVVLHRVKFHLPTTAAATSTDSIDWQSQPLEATIYRDETSAHNWKTVFAAQSDEATAVSVLTTVLS